jgi:16S rRNA (cytosine1402-N4)-methyltransferase
LRTSGSRWPHEPVLLDEALSALQPAAALRAQGPLPPARYIDGTVGGGGHAAAILEVTAPDGRLLGLDVDPRALDVARERLAPFGDRAVLVRENFAVLDDVAAAHGFLGSDGVLLDLGLSSLQLADDARGFSFRSEGPLDMRADPSLATTAADILNRADARELARIFGEYGEEPEARRVAEAIARRRVSRPFETAADLGRFVAGVKQRRAGAIDPATRVFQALRIAVNRELENLDKGLHAALRALRPGGRLAVISFHSLEDRAVKTFMARESRDCICPPHLPTCVCGHRAGLRVVTRRPVRPDAAEVARNPRARSAVLRVAEKLAS